MNDVQNETAKSAAYGNTYSESKGTGVISTLIFAVLVFVAMFLIAHFKGY